MEPVLPGPSGGSGLTRWVDPPEGPGPSPSRRAWRYASQAALGFGLMAALLSNRDPTGAGRSAGQSFRSQHASVLTASLGPPPPLVEAHRVPAPKADIPRRGGEIPARAPAAPAPSTVTPAPSPPATPKAPGSEPRRIRVRTENGATAVGRVYGPEGGPLHVLLPDGQIGIADAPAYTKEPFVPASFDAVEAELGAGEFRDFGRVRTPHYVIAYQGKKSFAEGSGRVLENLYKGLLEAFRKRQVPVHDAEFPLVAVIFKTEADFRAHKPVDKEIQAYYELYSNRIFFYENSERDEEAPEVAALRKPQTVAHEGTHQILQNVGIQPRLASWPPWLIEGLAEYCATPTTRKGLTTWSGLGMVNPLHLATIRDLNDPLTGQVAGANRPEHIGRPTGMPLVEYLVKKTDLTPTDYALAWAMTHYLAMKRVEPFLAYLKTMSAMPPLVPRTPADHLATFRAAFGTDLGRLDRDINTYLGKLKVNFHLPYYAVVFQQPLNHGALVKRAAIVSQSPSMIRQWLDTITNPNAGPPEWDVFPFPNRTRALLTAEQWVQGRP